MDEEAVLSKTVEFVKQKLLSFDAAHDWWHVQRVWKNTLLLLTEEKDPDHFICQLAALLHDIGDPKFYEGDEKASRNVVEKFLQTLPLPEESIAEVMAIVQHVSFSKSFEKSAYFSPELAVVQDADRLDALGAIGIARAFSYGGFKNQEIFNPDQPFEPSNTKEEYKHKKASSIHHFYDKLLKLKDNMNTPTGKKIAAERHAFMVEYLVQFHAEWKRKK